MVVYSILRNVVGIILRRRVQTVVWIAVVALSCSVSWADDASCEAPPFPKSTNGSDPIFARKDWEAFHDYASRVALSGGIDSSQNGKADKPQKVGCPPPSQEDRIAADDSMRWIAQEGSPAPYLFSGMQPHGGQELALLGLVLGLILALPVCFTFLSRWHRSPKSWLQVFLWLATLVLMITQAWIYDHYENEFPKSPGLANFMSACTDETSESTAALRPFRIAAPR